MENKSPKTNKKYIMSEKTKKDIINACAFLFSKKGFHNTSISEIADACKLTKGALYWHFKNKEGLFYAVIDEVKKKWQQRVMKEVLKAKGAVKKLERMLDYNAKMAVEEKTLCVIPMVLVAELSEVNLKFESVLRKMYTEYRDFVANIINEGKKNKELKKDINSQIAASVIIGAIDGLLLQWILNRDTIQLKDLIGVLKKSILKGMISG